MAAEMAANPDQRAATQLRIIMIGQRLQDLQVFAVRCCSWSARDGQWTLIGLRARAVSMEGRTCHLRRRECPGAAGIGSTTCKTKESCNTIIMIGKRLQDFAGCGALLFMVGLRWPVDSDWTRGQSRVNGMEDVPLRRRGGPGAAGIAAPLV